MVGTRRVPWGVVVDKQTAILLGIFPTTGILLLNGFWNSSLYAWSVPVFWFADVTTHVLIPVTAGYLLYRCAGISPRNYGFVERRSTPIVDLIGATVITTFLFWLCYEQGSEFFGRLLRSEPSEFTYLVTLPERGLSRIALGVYFSVSAGVFEEMMYRGLPWLYFRMRFGTRKIVLPYTLASATLFGFAHWENGSHEIFATFLLGVVACLLYTKLRNLWPLVIAHVLLDLNAYL